MENLRKRALSALILGPVVLAAIYIGGGLFVFVVTVAAILAVREWVRMISGGLLGRAFWLSAASIVAANAVAVIWNPWSALAVALVLAALLAVVPGGLSARVIGNDRWVSAFGIPYISVSCVAIVWLRADPGAGLWLILYLFLSIWANDIAAYGFGKGVGGARLAPAISPKKTWAGFFGGTVSAGLVGGGLALMAGCREPLVALALGALLGVVGQIGDLFESWIKRRYKVKDSGALIPGHGGVLDRIDGLIAAAPVLAVFHATVGISLEWW